MDDIIRVFVGADRSQELAVKVLEFSIKRHTQSQVNVFPMIDLPIPSPEDPRNSQRTGFSFSRFCIPKLAGYKGKAVYMDADMIVFKNIEDLWKINVGDGKVAIQAYISNKEDPKIRIKQCAVMLLDCSKLSWDVAEIIKQMDDAKFNYEELMYNLCILNEEEIKYRIPGEWNSLEHFDARTCLLHYTDMSTQPWVSTKNKNGEIWLNEVRLMLNQGVLSINEIKNEIKLGYFRPSLLRDILFGHRIPIKFKVFFNNLNCLLDKLKGFKAHKKVFEIKKLRDKASKEYERKLNRL